MASFAQFLGRRVTVQYRIGDVLLPASGTFAADSGRSIFLEQHVEQKGKRSYFRWEIPYRAIHRIEEAVETTEPVSPEPVQSEPPMQSSAAKAGASSESIAFLVLPQRTKTV